MPITRPMARPNIRFCRTWCAGCRKRRGVRSRILRGGRSRRLTGWAITAGCPRSLSTCRPQNATRAGVLAGCGWPAADPVRSASRVARGRAGRPAVLAAVQRLEEGQGGVHVDIHADDLAAEVARLEGLGAERVGRARSWWVLRDPAGLLFCVMPEPVGSLSAGNARRWD